MGYTGLTVTNRNTTVRYWPYERDVRYVIPRTLRPIVAIITDSNDENSVKLKQKGGFGWGKRKKAKFYDF